MSEQNDKPTDTPETEAELERSLRACHSYACGPDFARKLEHERGDARSERDNLNRVVAMIAAERDDYKNHFEACEAQRQRQLIELDRLRKDLCEIAEGCGVGHPDIEESKRRIIAIREKRDALTNQLSRICKEGFNNDDTIGGEPADDYVLRQIGKLKADKVRLDWMEELDPDSSAWVDIADAIRIRKAIDAAMKGGAA